jgi:hypothetical protein
MGKPMIERRYRPFSEFEVRAADGDGDAGMPVLAGHASVFGHEAIIWDAWREKVAPGAFKKTIKEQDIRALFNHDANIVLGRNKAGTLTLREDATGLVTEISPPDNEWGRPVVDAIKRGDVSQMSIGFMVVKQEWEEGKTPRDLPLRTITEARLFDVSPVTFPAFDMTDIAARSEDGSEPEPDPLESARRLVRCADAGYRFSARDRETVAAAQAILAPYLADEPGRHHSEESEPGEHHSLDLLRRQLELVTIEEVRNA